MVSKQRIIIDTDPGIDDILAICLAAAAASDELEILLISLTYGNVDVQNCLRNLITLFHHVDLEMKWRASNGRPKGFDSLRVSKPLVAIGAKKPLADQMMMADYFHGRDGLGGIHESHPEMTPTQTWESLFESSPEARNESSPPDRLFVPSQSEAHEEILRLLRENDDQTIKIVAIGPLTNLAKAAAQDPETFARAQEVIVMGGTINESGNVRSSPAPDIRSPSPPAPAYRLTKAPSTPLRAALNVCNQITPVAEFNTFADSVAAARVFALTSPRPNSTMPPAPPAPPGSSSQQGANTAPPPFLGLYPQDMSSRRLPLTLCPLDITTPHTLTRGQFKSVVEPLLQKGSPLAAWINAFMSSTFAKIETLRKGVSGDTVGLALHDPLCVWYVLTSQQPGWKLAHDEDIRVETSGQWTRGMCVVDRRSRKRRDADDGEGERPGDTGNWLSPNAGNRLRRCVSTPGEDALAPFLLDKIFGL